MLQVNPQMITLARNSRGLNQTRLAKEIGIDQGLLSKMEQGLYPFNDGVLNKIAKALNYPAQRFCVKDDILSPDLLYYRKRKAIPKGRLSTIDSTLHFRRMEIKSLMASFDLHQNIPYMSTRDYGSPKDIARLVRQAWKIPMGPLRNLVKRIEDNGIVVVFTNENSPKFDGMILPDASGVQIIYVNQEMPPDRIRFTLSHELGHLIMHSQIQPTMEEDVEKEANEFASEFLVPERDFLPSTLGTSMAIQQLADLKRYWWVSMAMLIYKAKETGVITPKRYKSLFVQMSRNGWRKQEPLCGVQKELPSLVRELVSAHISELDYSIEELAAITNLSPNEFRRIYLSQESKSPFIRVK